MKKIYLTFIAIFSIYQFSYAQWTTSGTTIYNSNTGNVGIGTTGTTVPQTNLHIVGSGTSIDGNLQYTGGGLIVQGNTGSRSSTMGAQLEFAIPANADGTNLWGQGRIITVAGTANNGDATGEMILGTRRYINKVGAGTNWYYGNDLVISGNGNILVGQTTQTNSSYRLDVAGGVRANAITVNTTGADFVFEPTYKLFSLPEIEKYIQQNHHLPEIPSAKEMQNDGLNVGDNQIKLLQKVEELTLYLIEKDKEIKTQREEINLLKQAAVLNTDNQDIAVLKEEVQKLITLINKK